MGNQQIEVIDSLKDSFLLEREDGMAGFLGLKIDKYTEDGSVTLTQEGLIDIILGAMNLYMILTQTTRQKIRYY